MAAAASIHDGGGVSKCDGRLMRNVLVRNTQYAIRNRTHTPTAGSLLHVTQYAKCSHNTEAVNTQRIKRGATSLLYRYR